MRPAQPLFGEIQAFSAGILALVAAVDVVVLGALVSAHASGKMELWVVLLAAGLMALPLGLLATMRLRTVVVPGALSVHLPVLLNRTIALRDIASAEVCAYRPIRDYGGWGVRWGAGGIAYNARGNRGVQLVLKTGKRVLIGSQRPEELIAAIEAGRT